MVNVGKMEKRGVDVASQINEMEIARRMEAVGAFFSYSSLFLSRS